jgi:Ni/Co efflux regulator RcnB
MRRIIILTLAATLLGGTAALAAPGDPGDQQQGDHGKPGDRGKPGDHGKPGDQGDRGKPGGQQGQPGGDHQGQPGGGQQSGPQNGPQHDGNLNNRGDRQRVDLKQYRRNLKSPHRFRAEPYHGPRGYHYRRWSHGQRLPGLYYARDFWLLDFLRFGLFAPPDGYIWVRYGPDALLVDQDTGEIVQVRYNVFY